MCFIFVFFLQDQEIKKLINSKFLVILSAFIWFYYYQVLWQLIKFYHYLTLFFILDLVYSQFFYFIILKHPKILKKIFFVFLVCYSILFVDGIYQYFNGHNLFFFLILLKKTG